MAQLSFTETTLASGKTVYVAEISDKKGTINVDLEREVPGLITVYHRAHGATTYKGGGSSSRILDCRRCELQYC